MRKRLLATLIVCAALATQFGASLAGAAAVRDGYAACHKFFSAAGADAAENQRAPAPASPSSHDHAACSLCQIGFNAIDVNLPALPWPTVEPHRQTVAALPEARPFACEYNRNAPARAPPGPV